MLQKLCKRCCSTIASPQTSFLAGLGNLGDKFNGTVHNVCFEMIDALAASQGMDTVHCETIFGKGFRFVAGPQERGTVGEDRVIRVEDIWIRSIQAFIVS